MIGTDPIALPTGSGTAAAIGRSIEVDTTGWQGAIDGLVAGASDLLGLWAETDTVYLACLQRASSSVSLLRLDCPQGRYPSVGAHHAPAQRLERAIADLTGLSAVGMSDTRPWLDHGVWGVNHPLGAAAPAPIAPHSYRFLAAEGPGLHQIPVGPVHAGIIEPGHFRFSASGETVVRLEERLGYVHKGVQWLMRGADPDRACRLAGRVSGDSTVAYAWSFARAVEAALELELPPRASFLRALACELERIANHLGDFGAICNDASFALIHTQCGVLREEVLRAAEFAFGHRLMRDCIVPGGVSGDITGSAAGRLRELLVLLRTRFSPLIDLYENTASLKDRTVTTGIVTGDLARRFAAGGFVGRASGRTFDTRRDLAYPPYEQLAFEIPVLSAGDVDARIWIRIREIEQSLGMVEQILERLPAGPCRIAVEARSGEGLAIVEGFRGDILVWLRLDAAGRVAQCHLRDPSWFQWPLLEAAIEGNIVADFPLCNKSFNCSYSGHDL